MLLSVTWNVAPAIFTIPFIDREIRWYGLLWVIGLIVAVVMVGKIFKHEKLPEKWFDSLFIYMMVGIIVGARLGHCLFYEPEYYLANPVEILKIWPCQSRRRHRHHYRRMALLPQCNQRKHVVDIRPGDGAYRLYSRLHPPREPDEPRDIRRPHRFALGLSFYR